MSRANVPPSLSAAEVLAQLRAQGLVPLGVADDSRQLSRGDLFLAYPGDLADGRAYIADAIARGAAAVLWECDDEFAWRPEWRIANQPARGLRALCGPLAHAICGQPSERLSLIVVTGTNGKTSISHWLAQAHPRPCASIGTLGAAFRGAPEPTGLTTPEATTLARCLRRFANAGARACALEASSIGIEEGRLDGAHVDVAIFTNLTRDHLDYHGTMDAYAAAKSRLFDWPGLRLAVINIDDPFGVELAGRTTARRVLCYTTQADKSAWAGIGCANVLHAGSIQQTAEGIGFWLTIPALPDAPDMPHGRARVETGLLGRYNVSNLLAVAAVLADAGLTPREIAERLHGLTPPPGRLEKIGGDGEPLIAVDYAHTPDALENALIALRGLAQARGGGLTVIFGCGGDRDGGKRPLMGEVAARLADRVVITSDNPRNEDPERIVEAIRAGAPDAELIVDRAAAIRRTVLAAPSAEVILLAGKGHEPYQEIAGERRPFSDVAEAQAALAVRREVRS